MPKKILRNNVLITILVGIICFNIGVNAGAKYSSDEIYYSTTGTSVTAELNNLQKIKTDLTSIKSQGTATAANILTGTSAVLKGTLTNGSMANNGGTTKTASTITESGTNALISIPSNGYYNTSSKLSIPITTIKNSIATLNSGVYYLGSGTSFDIKTFCNNKGLDYKILTNNNFLMQINGFSSVSTSGNLAGGSGGHNASWWRLSAQITEPSLSYDVSTGVLTVNNGTLSSWYTWDPGTGYWTGNRSGSKAITVNVYMVYGSIN